jgi:hypothetical protein
MESKVIFKQWITIAAVRDANGRWPARDWYDGLERRDQRRADAGMINFDATEKAGIRMTGRVEPVKGRRRTMIELKLTRGGSPGPQLRMLGVLRGRTFYVATGFHKRSRRLPRREIERAEAVLDAGLRDDDEDKAAEDSDEDEA